MEQHCRTSVRGTSWITPNTSERVHIQPQESASQMPRSAGTSTGSTRGSTATWSSLLNIRFKVKENTSFCRKHAHQADKPSDGVGDVSIEAARVQIQGPGHSNNGELDASGSLRNHRVSTDLWRLRINKDRQLRRFNRTYVSHDIVAIVEIGLGISVLPDMFSALHNNETKLLLLRATPS